MGTPFDLVIMTPSSAFGTSPTIPIGNPATINGVTYLSFAAAGASSGATISYSLLDPLNGGSETGTATYNSSTSLTSRTPTFSTNSSYINASSGCLIQSAIRAEDAAIVNLANTFSAAQTFSSAVTMNGTITMNGAVTANALFTAASAFVASSNVTVYGQSLTCQGTLASDQIMSTGAHLDTHGQTGVTVLNSSFQPITPATAGTGAFLMAITGTVQNGTPALFMLQDTITPIIITQIALTSSVWEASSNPLKYGVFYSTAAGRFEVANNIGGTETFKGLLLRFS